jgi:hypothetical protein
VDVTTARMLAERRQPQLFAVEVCVMPVYLVIAISASLPGVAFVIAVCRAERNDLGAIIRAWRMGPRGDDPKNPLRGDDGDDDSGKNPPPSLPQP